MRRGLTRCLDSVRCQVLELCAGASSTRSELKTDDLSPEEEQIILQKLEELQLAEQDDLSFPMEDQVDVEGLMPAETSGEVEPGASSLNLDVRGGMGKGEGWEGVSSEEGDIYSTVDDRGDYDDNLEDVGGPYLEEVEGEEAEGYEGEEMQYDDGDDVEDDEDESRYGSQADDVTNIGDFDEGEEEDVEEDEGEYQGDEDFGDDDAEDDDDYRDQGYDVGGSTLNLPYLDKLGEIIDAMDDPQSLRSIPPEIRAMNESFGISENTAGRMMYYSFSVDNCIQMGDVDEKV